MDKPRYIHSIVGHSIVDITLTDGDATNTTNIDIVSDSQSLSAKWDMGRNRKNVQQLENWLRYGEVNKNGTKTKT